MKILSILFKFLGDSVLATPALKALKTAYPESELHLLVPKNAQALFAHNPWVNCIWTVDKKASLPSTCKQIYKLRAQHFELSVDFVGNDRGALYSLLIGASKRLGPIAPKGFFGRALCYTHSTPEGAEALHATDRFFKVLDPLGLSFSKDTPLLYPQLYPDPTLTPRALQGRIVCSLTTSTHSKEWPLENWIALYKSLPALQNQFLFTAGPTQREIAFLEALQAALPQALCLKPAPSVAELLALIAVSKAVITPDSFPAHAAAALGIPVITLYGPTLPERWKPMGPKPVITLTAPNCHCQSFFYQCTQRKHCMQDLTCSNVERALLSIL